MHIIGTINSSQRQKGNLSVISAKPGIVRSELYKKMNLNSQPFTNYINELVDEEKICRHKRGKNVTYTAYYSLGRSVKSEKSLEKALLYNLDNARTAITKIEKNFLKFSYSRKMHLNNLLEYLPEELALDVPEPNLDVFLIKSMVGEIEKCLENIEDKPFYHAVSDASAHIANNLLNLLPDEDSQARKLYHARGKTKLEIKNKLDKLGKRKKSLWDDLEKIHRDVEHEYVSSDGFKKIIRKYSSCVF